MKFLAITLLLSQVALAAPEVIISPVEHLYVPDGFDSNDAVELVVTGSFPNPCYSRNKVQVKVVDDVIDIKVLALAPDDRTKGSRFCPQMLVPFKEVITVGNLQGGDYKINVNQNTRYALADKMIVKEATSSAVDENIYAAIEWVEAKGNDQFVLHGWRYSPCMELETVKVVSNKKDTLSVLPVMKQVSDFCPMKGIPVSYPVKFDFSGLKMKQPLLHVRTMDGKSVNTIIDLEGRR